MSGRTPATSRTRTTRRARTARRARRALVGTVVAVASVAATASGCSLAGTDFRPGLAAEVDGTDISLSTVDDVGGGYCGYQEATPNPQSIQVPRLIIRSTAARLLVEKAALEKILDERGLEPDSGLDSQLDSFREFLDTVPDEYADAVGTLNEASFYVSASLISLGNAELGTDVGSATQDQVTAAGARVLGAWLQDHDLELNPVLGLVSGDRGQVELDADDVSQAVSEEATAALIGRRQPTQADLQDLQAYTETLPDNQVC